MGRILRLTLIGYGALVVFVLLEACDRASSPAEHQERNVGVDEPEKTQAEAPPANKSAIEMPVGTFFGRSL